MPDQGNLIFAQVWQQALVAYQKESGRDLTKEEKLLQRLPTVDSLITHIEEKETYNKRVREKHRIWSILKSSITPLENLTNLGKTVVGIGISGCMPAAVILGALSFLLDAAKGVSAVYDSIADMLSQVENFTKRFAQYMKGVMDEELQKISVDIFATLLLIFARSEKLVEDGTAGHITGLRMKAFMQTAFLGNDDKIKSYMKRLERLVDVELMMAISIIFSTTKRTEASTARIEEVAKESKTNTEFIMTSLRDTTDLQLVKDTLDSPAIAKVVKCQLDYADERLQGTCDWLKDVPLYKRWLDQSDPLLWILGGPGAGKSYLSSSILSHLQHLYPQDPELPCRTSVGYFYIKEDDQQLQSVSTILQSLAFQIASNNAVYHKYIAYNVCRFPQKISTERGLWTHLFLDFFGSAQYADETVFLVIDGVDEAPRRSISILLRLIEGLENTPETHERPRIQVALIGRPEIEELASSIMRRPVQYIAMSSENSAEDIRRYAKESINRVKILKSARMIANPKERAFLARKIFQKLIEHANGMFLWVRLMVDQITEMSRPQSIYEALETAPPRLEEMIRHIFERLARDPSVVDALGDLNEILAWVALARRPLLLGEIHVVLRLRSPTGEAMYLLEEKLKGPFASFFTLSEEADSKILDFLADERIPPEAIQLKQEDLTTPSIEAEDFDWESETFDDEANTDDVNLQSDLTLLKKLDVSSDRSLPLHFKTTMIKFSHASIRDFLLKERISDSHAPLTIGFDPSKAELRITEVCLTLLSEGHVSSTFEVHSLSAYAAHNFASHLLSLYRSTLSNEEAEVITRQLCLLFYEEGAISNWLDSITDHELFLEHWFGSDRLVRCVREWFSDAAAAKDCLNTSQHQFIAAAATSARKLFEPFATLCAKRWLEDLSTTSDATIYVWFLHIYSRLDESDPSFSSIYQTQIDRARISKIPADQLRSLANIIPLEKTSQWYGNLGRVLRNAGHLNAAMEEFATAITILESWEWQTSLASCYAQLGDYPAAIKWGSKALRTPDHMRRATTLTDIAGWYLALPTPDVSKAIQSAKEAHSLDSADMRTIAIYLKALYAGRSFQQMVDLVEVIVRASQASPHNPLITKFLQFQVHKMIGIAAQQVKQPELIYNALTTSIASCEEQKDFTRAAAQRYILALALLRLQNRKAEAMALMEQVFQEVKDNKYTSPRWYLRKGSIDRLSQFYFDNATKAEDNGDDLGEWISKLQALAMHSKAVSRGFKWYSTNTASLMLGLWHVRHNRRKEAKACMKGLILEALDLLRDNDPTNDIAGYHVLGQSLLFFGDEVNAVGAFALINAPFEKLKVNRALLKSSNSVTQSSNTHTHELSSPQVETSVIAPNTPPRSSTIPGASLFAAAEKLEDQAQTWTPAMFYECQNGCDENIDRFKACYACRTCFKKYHCDECMKKILTSGAVFFNCAPTDKFFQVYPLPDSIVDAEVMRIGGEKVSRTQWLAGLRREWLDDEFVREPSAVPKNDTLGILPS